MESDFSKAQRKRESLLSSCAIWIPIHAEKYPIDCKLILSERDTCTKFSAPIQILVEFLVGVRFTFRAIFCPGTSEKLMAQIIQSLETYSDQTMLIEIIFVNVYNTIWNSKYLLLLSFRNSSINFTQSKPYFIPSKQQYLPKV